MNYFWLNKHWQQWQASLASDHKPQAVIIHGAEGMGKAELLNQIVADLLCREQPQGHCGQCQNCVLFGQQHHPDVDLLLPEKNVLKVNMIRDLIEFFTSTPHCSDHKVAILMQAHCMNQAAANALLKVLEEPPSRGLLFLVTDRKHQLMPTIRSRCVSLDVSLSRSEQQQVPHWLAEQGTFSTEQIHDSLALSGGQPLAALTVLQQEKLSEFEQHLDCIHNAIIQKTSVQQAAKQLNEYTETTIWSLMQRYCLQLAKAQLNANSHEIYARHPLNQLVKKSPKVIHIIVKFTDLIQQIMLNFNTQIKTQLLLESMLVEIKNVMSEGN